jgi:hypothetical protein
MASIMVWERKKEKKKNRVYTMETAFPLDDGNLSMAGEYYYLL